MLNFFHKKQEISVAPIIIITLNTEYIYNIEFKIVAKTFVINWGDNEINSLSSHVYKERKQYKVTITGTYIIEFYANNCGISKLEFTNCTDLFILECNFNQLEYLDLSKCINLGEIHCSDNKITTLKLDKLREIEILICCYNRIQQLNLRKCHSLNYLDFEENKVSKLNLGHVQYLYRLKCSNNPITLKQINKNLPKQIKISSQYILTIDKKQENPKIEEQIIKKEWYIEKRR